MDSCLHQFSKAKHLQKPSCLTNSSAYKETPGLVALNAVMMNGDCQEIPSSATLVLHYTGLVIWKKYRYVVLSVLILKGQYKDFIMGGILSFCNS